MIDKSLEFIRGRLNEHIKKKFELTQDKVRLSAIMKQNGNVDPEFVNDSVFIMLINVQEEPAIQSPTKYLNPENIEFSSVNPDMNINLVMLVIVNFTHYAEALKFLTAVIGFFQSQPVFSSENSAGFNLEGISKIRVRFVSQTQEQQNHLWGTLGAKYMPSAMYRVRLLKIQENEIRERTPQITTINREYMQS